MVPQNAAVTAPRASPAKASQALTVKKPHASSAAVDGKPPARLVKSPPVAPSVAPDVAKPRQPDPDMVMLDMKHVFQPIQMLMDAPVTIEYGEGLKETRTVHEGLLLSHSKHLENTYQKAQQLRKKYASCEKLSEDVDSLVMQELAEEDVLEGEMREEIISAITNACTRYPFPASREQLKKEIISAARNHIETPTKGRGKKESHGITSLEGLECLNPEGLISVLDSLSAKLRKLRAQEKENAKKDPIKAAAQGRLILFNEDGKTIQSLMAWLYQQSLNHENADHLYAIYRLAAKLGIEVLAERCLDKLCKDTVDGLEKARSQNLPLQYLLGYGISAKFEGKVPTMAVDNVVAIVFKHVTKDQDLPERLLQIFVDAMAESLDMELWALLKDVLGRDKMAALIQAMLTRQVKIERSTHVKSESG